MTDRMTEQEIHAALDTAKDGDVWFAEARAVDTTMTYEGPIEVEGARVRFSVGASVRDSTGRLWRNAVAVRRVKAAPFVLPTEPGSLVKARTKAGDERLLIHDGHATIPWVVFSAEGYRKGEYFPREVLDLYTDFRLPVSQAVWEDES